MKLSSISLIILTVSIFSSFGFADEGPRYSNDFLLSVYFKAVELRDNAIAEIKKIDMEIQKNEEAIKKSERIISLAQQRNDEKAKQAEIIARNGLAKAAEAKARNEETKKELERLKARADRSLATVQNELARNNGSNQKVKGFVSGFSGRVEILKADGTAVTAENNFLEPGDTVLTYDGSAEIQMLDGRATTKIGPYSEFLMKKDTPEEQTVELLKGKVYMAVDKIDEFAKKMKEKIEEYKEDLRTTRDLKKEDIEYFLEHSKLNKKFTHKCPTAVLGIRGTKYTVDVKDGNTAEIIVLEGSVEVSNIKGDERIIVEEGYRVIATRDGISDPQKIGQIEKWWEK